MRTFVFVVGILLASSAFAAADEPLRVGVFRVDVSPPIGSPVAYVIAKKIEDPISARGIVIRGAGKPIVLCAVDSLGIGNESYEQWRETLAKAVNTEPSRVAVHVLHQHDAPRHDVTVERLLDAHGLGGARFDVGYMRDCLSKVGNAATEASKNAKACTSIEIGQAKVDKVASNRRILGPDGKVKIVRWSATKDPAAIAAPEGLIDPYLKLVCFKGDDGPIACLTYYACHPQSYYRTGGVTSEFVGIARAQREKETDVPHVHFNGASGNITAGKYNDGSHAVRPVLAERVAAGMKGASEDRRSIKVTPADVEWRETLVHLPADARLDKDKAAKILADPKAKEMTRFDAASQLAFLQRSKKDGYPVSLTCLKIGSVWMLHLPGELFVEYQLAAQELRPKDFVCTAAYGDYSPFYIGTAAAYPEGGYETSPNATHVGPGVERVLREGIRDLLK